MNLGETIIYYGPEGMLLYVSVPNLSLGSCYKMLPHIEQKSVSLSLQFTGPRLGAPRIFRPVMVRSLSVLFICPRPTDIPG